MLAWGNPSQQHHIHCSPAQVPCTTHTSCTQGSRLAAFSMSCCSALSRCSGLPSTAWNSRCAAWRMSASPFTCQGSRPGASTLLHFASYWCMQAQSLTYSTSTARPSYIVDALRLHLKTLHVIFHSRKTVCT